MSGEEQHTYYVECIICIDGGKDVMTEWSFCFPDALCSVVCFS